MKKYLDLIRVKHWIKNLLIFIPLVGAGLYEYQDIIRTVMGFFSFSFMSSFIYILNDIKDIEKDRMHPRKKKRPLASGIIRKKTAVIIAVLVILTSVIFNFAVKQTFFSVSLFLLLIYMLLNIFYSCGLKDVAIVDICVLASGFVLRVYYGASLLGILVSNWLFLTILNASLFLGLGKRKKELANTKNTRKVLAQYNEAFLGNFQYICLSLTLVFYSLWTMEQDIDLLIFTVPLVIIIFMRYCLIIEKNDEGDPTTILFQDKPLLSMGMLYGLVMIILLVVR